MSKYLHKITDLICKDVKDKTLFLSWTPITIENTKVLYRLNILTKNTVKISVNNISKNYFNFVDPDATFNQKYYVSIIPYIQDTNYPFKNYIDNEFNNGDSLSKIINLPNLVAIGTESDKILITTDLEPINLDTNVDSLFVDLHWNNINGAINYTIKYDSFEVNTTNNYYKIENLEPNTNYTISVIANAENSKNNSEISINIKTKIHNLLIDENSFDVLDKIYDGNNSATISNIPSTLNYFGNKNITIKLKSSEFVSNQAQNNLKVISKFEIDNPDFILINNSIEKNATIHKKEINCGVIAIDKIYDGLENVSVVINQVSGIINNDNVKITPIGIANDYNVKAFVNVNITFELNNNNYYVKPQVKTININPKELQCALTIEPKLYDNNSKAIISNYKLSGLVNNENINILINGTYENNKVNENAVIYIRYNLLDGINTASNYFIKNTVKGNLVKLNPIENIIASKISDNSLELSWIDSKNNKDDIVSYQVIFNNIKLYTQTNSISINGLNANTFYNFSIYVLSKMPKCCSEATNITVQTIGNINKESINFDLITSNTIALSWPNMGSDFTYTISYSKTSNFSNLTTIETNNNFIELNNLLEGTNYYFKLQPKQLDIIFSIIEFQKQTLPILNLLNQHDNPNNVINILNNFKPIKNVDIVNTSIYSTSYIPSGTIFRSNYTNNVELITGEYSNKYVFSKSLNNCVIKNNSIQHGMYYIVNTIPINDNDNIIHKFHLNVYNSSEKIINNLNLTYSVDYITNTEFPINHINLKLYIKNNFIGNLNRTNNKFWINIDKTLLNYSDCVFYLVRDTKEVSIHGNYFINNIKKDVPQSNDILLFDNKNKIERVKIIAKLKKLSDDDLETSAFVLNTMNNFNYVKYLTLQYNDEKIIIDMDNLQLVNGSNDDYNNYKLKQFKYIEQNIITSDIISDKFGLEKYYSWIQKKNLGNKLNFDGKSKSINIKGVNVNYTIKLTCDKNCANIRNEITLKGSNIFSGCGVLSEN